MIERYAVVEKLVSCSQSARTDLLAFADFLDQLTQEE